MDNLESSCIALEEITQGGKLRAKKFELDELKPAECCLVKIPFHALKPGKHTIQAQFTYKEGKLNPIMAMTEVDSTIEAELNIGIVMLAFTLTRLSLNFTLDSQV
jgi:hypothetical protein